MAEFLWDISYSISYQKCQPTSYFVAELLGKRYALQMFTGNYRDSTGKLECRDFKFMGITCIPTIPVILKSPHSYFHCNICKEFFLQRCCRDSPQHPCKIKFPANIIMEIRVWRFQNYRDCGYTCNPPKFEIPALRFPCKVPAIPCKHLQ